MLNTIHETRVSNEQYDKLSFTSDKYPKTRIYARYECLCFESNKSYFIIATYPDQATAEEKARIYAHIILNSEHPRQTARELAGLQ